MNLASSYDTRDSLGKLWGLPVLLTLLVFTLDYFAPLGIAIGTLYIPIFIFLTRLPGRKITFISAAIFSSLIIIAALLHRPSFDDLYVFLNRAISIVLVWVIAFVINSFKSVEKGLQRSMVSAQRKYNQMTSDVKDYAFFLLSADGYIENWNKGISRLTGFSKGELIGKHFSVFFHPKDRDQALPDLLLKDAIRDGAIKYEGKVTSRNAGELWAEITITCLRDRNKQVSGYSIVLHDRNAQKEYEQSLIKTNKEIMRKNEELKQFAYISTHDLQEPLRTITSYVSFIQSNYQLQELDERGRKGFQFILDSSKRMSNLLKGLLDYLNIGEDAIKEKIDLKEMVGELLQTLGGWLNQMDVKIEVKHLPVVKGLKSEMQSLFNHLLDNAIKFRQPDRACRIEIDSIIKDNMWLFTVKDNGIGMAQNHHDKAFKIFQQLHNKNVYEGSGIGLAHCKKIVELHGGKIWLNSELDKGTTIFFTLPLS